MLNDTKTPQTPKNNIIRHNYLTDLINLFKHGGKKALELQKAFRFLKVNIQWT